MNLKETILKGATTWSEMKQQTNTLQATGGQRICIFPCKVPFECWLAVCFRETIKLSIFQGEKKRALHLDLNPCPGLFLTRLVCKTVTCALRTHSED